MSVFNLHQGVVAGTAAAGGSAVFDSTLISNSVWVDGSSDQLELAKTSGGSASSKFTVSCWVLRNEFAEGSFAGIFNHHYSSNTGVQLHWLNDNTLTWIVFSSVSGAGSQVTSNEVFVDVGWYHILANYDGTNGRMQLFVNGELVGSNDVGEKRFTAGSTNPIGSGTGGASYYWGAVKNTAGTFGRTNSYLAQCALELGTAAVPSDYVDTFTFGTNGSQVIPKKSSDLVARINSAGGHSHLLDFSDASNLGNDISTNNNDFTATSMSTANHSSNTPSLVYPLLNPLSAAFSTPISEGGTRATGSSGNGDDINPGIIIPKTGKWVWQITNSTDADLIYGVRNFEDMKAASYDYTNLYGFYSHTGNLVQGASPSGSYLDAASGGDVYQIYYDADTRKMWVSDNGVIPNSGNPDAGSNEAFTIPDSGFDLCPTALVGGTTPDTTFDFGMDGVTLHANGQNFKPLTSANLPTPDYQGIDYFESTIYEGNGTGQRVGDFVPFTDAYTVDKSAMFDITQQNRLTRDFVTPTDADRFVFSSWLKPSTGQRVQVFYSGNTDSPYTSNSTDGVVLELDPTNTGIGTSGISYSASGNGTLLVLNRNLEQTSEWFHFLISYEESPSEGAGTNGVNKLKIYVNGVQQTYSLVGGGGSVTTPGWNASGRTFVIGAGQLSPAQYYSGYVAETVFIDGGSIQNGDVSLSNFGSTDTSTNKWVPANISGQSFTFGNNGFYLEYKGDFSSVSLGNDAGKDSSGEGHHFVQGSFNAAWTAANQFTDTPSKNFCTWDDGRNAGHTLTEGALKATGGAVSSSQFDTGLGTMFVSSGKYYWEINRDNDPAGTDRFRTGVAQDSIAAVMSSDDRKDFWGLSENGQIHGGGLALTSGYGVTTTTGDYIGVALDMDRHAIYFSKNGTWMNSASASGIADGSDLAKAAHTNVIGSVTPFISTYDAQVATLRTASGNWEGTAPTGFLELNQDNLDATASKLTAWAWIKNRDATDSNILVDRVRGDGKVVHTNETAVEATEINTVQRFLQRGVQVGDDVQVNTVNESYVLWQWLVGSSATTTTPSGGSIASTVAAADAGHFSVVGFTGATGVQTIAHGMAGTPEMMIFINREQNGANRTVYHKKIGNNNYILLSSNAAKPGSGNTNYFNDTDPNSTVFTIGSGATPDTNGNGQGMIVYCFRSVPGVCKVGSYEGNNAADGTYVNLGFKPAWVMAKNIDASGSWFIIDNKRGFNSASNESYLQAESTATETTGNVARLLSNGIKWNTTGGGNASNTFIYLAMAELGGNGTLPPIYGR